MRYYACFILLSLLLTISVGYGGERDALTPAAPESVGMSSIGLSKIDDEMNRRVADGKLAGGVVVVARRGKVVYHKAFGQRDMDAGQPMENDTIVRLYSMTKAIVTSGTLMLMEEGRIELDAPVSQYIPAIADVKVWTPDGLVAPKRAMTVRDLMRHTAGFGGYSGDVVASKMNEAKLGEARDLDDLVTRLATVPLACHPGEKFIYSRSIDVLGLIMQKTSGKDLDVFLHDRLLDPLGMVDTDFWVPSAKRDRFAVNYSDAEGTLKVIPGERANEKYYARPGLLSGGGGLVGTAGDYMRFLLMISGGGSWNGKRYLKPETVALMTHDQLPPEAFPIWSARGVKHGTGFGLGFSVRTADTDWDPDARIGEYAWDGAASTHYWVSPKDDNLIVVTVEQVMPFNFDTAWALKPVVYESLLGSR